MRNKAAFISDINQVVKKDYQENAVEDAAHTLNHVEGNVYTVEPEFTVTNQPEKFLFEQKERAKTDNPEETMTDWFYVSRLVESGEE